MKIPRFGLSPVFAASIAVFVCVSSMRAASGTWSATPTDANWVPTGTNWSNGATLFPGATSGTTNADIATFSGASTQTAITINSATLNFKSILFDTVSAAAYTIGTTGGNSLLLTSGGSITMNATVANTETINAPLMIQAAGGSYTIQNNATDNSKLLNIGGAITGGAAGQTTLTLGGTNTGNNTISGNISNGSATNFAIVKNGAGTWVLSGTNAISNSQNFNSAVAVNAGTLNIQGATTVSFGRITVVAGSTLDVSGAGTVAVTGGTTNTPVSISGVLLLDDTGAIQKTNRFSGGFTLNSGGAFSYLGNASANSTETNTGSITLGSGLSKITVAYGGTQAATVTEASLSHTASTGGLALINGTNLGANTVAGGSVGQFLTTSLPTLVGTTTGGSTGISSGVTNTKVALFLLGESGTATGAKGTATGAANTFLTYNATTGYRPLNPTDEFTNDAIVAGDNTYLTTGTTTTSGTNAINSLVVNGGNLAITGGTLTNTSGMLLFAQNGTISGAGTFTLGGSSNQEGVVALDSGVNATISSVLGTGTTGLTVSGPGTLTLSGANSYAGTTAVGVGSTLIIGNNSALGSSKITAVGGTIQGDGQARTISNTLIDTTSGMMIGGASDLTFTGGGTVGTPAFANSTSANSQVKINNTGTTTFSGVFSLNNQTSGSNNGASILGFGSSANVVISGPIQDNNTGNVASPTTGFGSLTFTGVGANLTISPTASNNAYGVGKTTAIVSSGAYNTVTVGGPGGSGATITPFGATTLSSNNSNPLFLVAETNGQILGNNFGTGGSGMAYGFAGTNSMTLGGTWAGNGGSLTNLATGTFTFGNTISGNALSLFGTGNTTLNSSATLATGASALTATQTGTVTLSSVNNFTGVTAFSGGTVVLDYSTNNNTKLTQNSGAGVATALSLSGVNLQLSGGSFAQTLGTPSSLTNGTTLNAGQSKITRTSGTSTIALGGITRSAGAAIDFQTGVASTTTAGAAGILGGYATVGGTDWATGGGTIAALGSYDSFATPGTNKNILQADGGSVAATTTVNSLKITTSTTGQSLAITSGQTLSLTTGGLLFTGANDYSITGGTLKPTASGGDFIVQQYGGGILQIDSVLGNSTTSTLTKAGTGTLVLTGTNTYAGGTFVSGGVLSVSADANLGATAGSAITLNSGTLQVTGSGFTTAHTISLGTNGGTFQVDTGTLTSTGVISGTSYKGLTKTGAGTLLLQGTNTFLGPVTVTLGTLQLGNAAALGASSTGSNRSVAPVLVNGGTLDINGQTTALGNVTLQSGAISDTTGTGTLAAYSFNLQSGTVGAKLVDLVFTGNTNSNSINLYKTTSGTVTLSGANTYTGGTTISGGKLSIASTGTINTSGGVFIGAGEFNYNSSTALSAPVNFTSTGGKLSGIGTISSAVTVTSGNTLSPGNSPGVMTFNNTLTLAGATAMEANGTVRGTSYDGINTGTSLLTYGGTLTITFGSTFLTGGETFDLFNIGAGGSTGSFSLVSVAGSYVTGLTNNSGVWTGSNGGYDFTFTQSTGDLVIGAIPEPATYAMIAGCGLLGFALWRKRGARA